MPLLLALGMAACAGRALAQAEAPGGAATAPARASLLLLPSLQEAGERPVSPWSSRGDAPRFERFEKALAARLEAAGFAVITTESVRSDKVVRDALAAASGPPSAGEASAAARAAGAQAALVVSGEVIRARGAGPSRPDTTDALVRAEAFRASDGARLTWASTRVTGSGRGAAEADAEALAHAAAPLAEALEAPLRSALARPVLEPRPMPLVIEGRLDWRGYQQVIAMIRDALPEIGSLQERRFAPGEFTLMTVCACEPAEAALRLDGMARGGLRLAASAGGATLRLRATRAGASGDARP